MPNCSIKLISQNFPLYPRSLYPEVTPSTLPESLLPYF